MPIGRPRGGKNRYHSKDFKLGVVRRVLAGESKRNVADEYELSHGMVTKWVKLFREKGEKGLENTKSPGNPFAGLHRKKYISEVEQLRYELAKAEVELAKLKKSYQMERSGATRKK